MVMRNDEGLMILQYIEALSFEVQREPEAEPS